MDVSVLYPRHLLKCPSGLVVGSFEPDLNCYCVTAISQLPLEPKSRKYLQRSITSIHNDNTKGTAQFLGIQVQSGDEFHEKDLLHLCQNQNFVIFYPKSDRITVQLLNKQKITGDFFEPMQFIYEQQEVFLGLDSYPTWSEKCQVSQNASSKPSCGDLVSPNFSFMNVKLIGFLYEANIFTLSLQEQKTLQCYATSKQPSSIFTTFIQLYLIFISAFLIGSSVLSRLFLFTVKVPLLKTILKFTSFGSQLILKAELLSKLNNKEKLSQMTKNNIVMGMVLDVVVGLSVFYIISTSADIFNNDSFNILMTSISYIGKQVEQLIQWLMGIPIGLKLNSQLNQFLGKFFLHHVQLWLEYIQLVLTSLHNQQEYFISWILVLSCFGLSLLVAIISDVVSLLSFHIYCFYVYAARLYRLQFIGLMSLWRLFRGKKWNPLRHRVDTLPDLSDGENPRFFLGTLLFTILLFLLPTTALYYAIFAALRVAIMVVQNSLSYLENFLACFPWCTLLTRFTRPLAHPASARFKTIDKYDPGVFLPREEYLIDVPRPTAFTVSIEPKSYWSSICKALDRLGFTHFYAQYNLKSLVTSLTTGSLLKWS